MTLTQLSNFVRIAELQSLSKAAAVVRIAQPALSRQVRQLEAELDAPLLVRHAWGVTLTAAGAALLTSARRLLREADGVKDTVHALATHPRGRLSLGVPASVAASLLPPLAAALLHKYPDLEPHMVEGFSAILQPRMLAGELDMAVLYEDRNYGALAATPLLTERLMLVGPAGGHARGTTTAESLRGGVLLLPSRPNRLRLLVDDALAQQTAQEPKIVEVDSLSALLAMVEGGAGYTVLPYSTVALEVERGVLSVWELEFPPLLRTLMLVRPTDRLSSAANAAVEAEIYALVNSVAPTLRWKPFSPEGELLAL